MSLVLDSSVTLAWCFEDERTPAVRAILDAVVEGGAAVPLLWRYEVANGLQMAQRRNRIDAAFRDRVLANLSELGIQTDDDSDALVWPATTKLAELFGLTVYDAAYLELAQRRRLPLATLDSALTGAAQAAGVSLQVRPLR